MNRIYNLVWSTVTNSWCCVAECVSSRGKASRSGARSGAGVGSNAGGTAWLIGLFFAIPIPVLAATPPAPTALPTGGQVVAGQAQISTNAPAQLTITQATNRAAINWQSFNIGAAARVDFVQPSSASVALNRVLGSDPSQIFGSLTSNGSVYLSNPNGVLFAPGSSVNVGAIVATTMSISNDDFMAGKDTFTRNGSTASVVNQGTITTANGGYAALLAPEVRNEGVIIANAGTVALAAGEAITLYFAPDSKLANITVTPAQIKTLVANRRAVIAEGGQIILSSRAVETLMGSVVNSGTLSASSIVDKGGVITIVGDDIALADTSRIEATGATGGGTVLVGGDAKGQGDLHQATSVSMAEGATIDASATRQGDGGSVVLFSQLHNDAAKTAVHGSIKAQAGSEGGKGGLVETSGANVDFAGIRVDTSAAKGATGDWLVDPYDLTVDSSAASTINTNLSSTNVTLQTTSSGTSGPGTANASGVGDININSGITWTSGNTLTLDAYRNININAAVSAGNTGKVVMITGDTGANQTSTGGDYSFGLASSGFAGKLTFGSTASTATLAINGAAYTLVYTKANITSIGTGGAGFALATDLDLSSSGTLSTAVNPSTLGGGTVFTGLGHVVSNMTISTTGQFAGLFANQSSATTTLRDVGISNANVTTSNTNSRAGLLSGTTYGVVKNVFVNGTLTATAQNGGQVGLLIGQVNNGATISNVFASGAVVVSGTTASVGGLIGTHANGASLNTAYSTASVTSTASGGSVGGLVGNTATGTTTIRNAYSTGAVSASGTSDSGGLLGTGGAGSTVIDTYATGAVSGSNSGGKGGLVGTTSGTVTDSYYDSTTTGQSDTGKGTGQSTGQLQNGMYPNGFSASVWGVIAGAYPYLGISPTPAGVGQLLSGTAYLSDGTTGANAGFVNLYLGGSLLGTATTNASGAWAYNVAAGTVSATTPLGETLALSGAPATVVGASYSDTRVLSSGNFTGFNVTQGVFDYYTGSTTLSGLNSIAAVPFGAGLYSSLTSTLSGAAKQYRGAGNFTVDTAPSTGSAVMLQAAGGDLTIATALPWATTNTLTLDAFHSINVNAPITAANNSHVVIKTNDGGTGGDYSFNLGPSGFGGNLTFGSTVSTATLAINGNNYTLVYDLTNGANGLQNLNGQTTGNYALANSLDASSLGTPTAAVVGTFGDATHHALNFTGLGNSITSLTLAPTSSNAGLFGTNFAVVRDIGVSGSLTVSSFSLNSLGLLAGAVNGGTVKNAFSSGSVDVTPGGNNSILGGLVGQMTNATVDHSYSSATVKSTGNSTGGLVGQLDTGTVSNSYATGAVTVGAAAGSNEGGLIGAINPSSSAGRVAVVSNSYATGNVTNTYGAGTHVGGLIGYANGAGAGSSVTVTNSYSTGTVSAQAAGVGGLIGEADGALTISSTYATGSVTSPSNDLGGLIGAIANVNGVTLSQSYATGNVSTGNGSNVGGLVGNITGPTTINTSFATGNVTSATGSEVGGLLGNTTGAQTIADVYAKGNVSGSQFVGGLAGWLQNGGTVTNAYSTGTTPTVSGGNFVAPSIGAAGNATLTNVYWDSAAGTTGAFQAGGTNTNFSGVSTLNNGSLPTGFNSGTPNGTPWGIAAPFTPYFNFQFPNGIQTISGTGFTSTGAAAGAGTIQLYTNGATISGGMVTTAANGTYTAAVNAGTVVAGQALGGTLTLNGAGAISGATYSDNPTFSGSNVVGFDIKSGSFTFNTGTSTVTGFNSSNPAAAFGSTNFTNIDSTLSTAIKQINAAGGFTVDTPLSQSGGIGITAAGDLVVNSTLSSSAGPITLKTSAAGSGSGDITINQPETVTGTGGLTLDAFHSVNVNAPITVTGAAPVVIKTNDGGTGGDYSFDLTANGFLGSLSFTNAAGGGQSLNINGNAYTLLYTQANLAGITGSTGKFALANSLDLSGAGTLTASLVTTTGSGAVVTGLGHTVNNMTIADSANTVIGLIGTNNGVVRDIGVVGGSVSSTNTTASSVGALIGVNAGGGTQGQTTNGIVLNAYTTSNVSASNNSASAGGLIGVSNGFGMATTVFATGAVTTPGTTTHTGGLIGMANSMSISNAFATGAVTTGGTSDGGGLLGGCFVSCNINNAYATGAVSSPSSAYGAGGLIGETSGGTANVISNVYATGAVSYVGGTMGGLIGRHGAVATTTLSNAYYDGGTTGQSDTGKGLSQTTAQLQSGSLPSGFASTAWTAGSGLYPYLTQFFPNGVSTISGTTYAANGTAAAVSTVNLYAGGAAVSTLGAVKSGANGYYYAVTPTGILPATATAKLAGTETLSGAGSVSGATYTDAPTVSGGNITGLDIKSGLYLISTAATSLSALGTDLANTYGSTNASNVSTATNAGAGQINASGAFNVNGAISQGGTLGLNAMGGDLTLNAAVSSAAQINLQSSGNVTDGASGSVSAPKLVLLGGNVTLDSASNSVTTMAAQNVGSLVYNNAGTLTIGSVGPFNTGITAAAINGTSTTVAGIAATSNVTVSALSGDLFEFGNIVQNLMAADSTVTLKAAGNITVGSSNTIDGTQNANTKKLNVVLWSDTDGNGDGAILVGTSTATPIVTNGGHVWMGGGSGSTTWNGLTVGNGLATLNSAGGGFYGGVGLVRGSLVTAGGDVSLNGLSVRNSGFSTGVILDQASISAGGGNVTINGTFNNAAATSATADAIGVVVHNGSSVTTTGSGAINITGTITAAGSAGAAFATAIGSHVTTTTGTSSGNVTISSAAGAINITGTGARASAAGSFNSGVSIVSKGSDAVTVSSTSGNITVNGTANYGSSANTVGTDIDVYATGSVKVVSGSGNISLIGANNIATPVSGKAALRFNAANGSPAGTIKIGYDGTNAYSGNILVQGDSIDQAVANASAGSISMQGTGTLTIEPAGSTFTSMTVAGAASGPVTFDNDWDFGTTHNAVTIGKSTSTYDVTVLGALTAAGPVTIYGGNLAVNAALTATNSTITLQGTGNVTDSSTGSVTANNLLLLGGNVTLDSAANDVATLAATGVSGLTYVDANAFTVGTVGATNGISASGAVSVTALSNDITVAQALTSGGNASIIGGNLAINAAVTATGSTLTLQSTGNVTEGASGSVIGNSLALQGGNVTLTNATNNFVKMAASGVGNLSYVDADVLGLSTASSLTGISATGQINIATVAGNLGVSQAITTTDTSSAAITLNASRGSAAGVSTGGNINVGGSVSFTTGTGGRTTLYTGATSDTTLATLIGSGTGRFRYNSDEASTNYTTALGSGIYEIYRQAITTSIAADLQSLVYGAGTSALTSTNNLVNGDTASIAVASPQTSTSGNLKVGSYSISASNLAGLTALGYTSSGNSGGTLTVTPKAITVSGLSASNKSYDGSAAATLTGTASYSGVISGDVVTETAGGSFSDKNVGTGKAVTLTASLGGTDAGNYSFTNASTTANITQANLVLSTSNVSKVYDGGLSALGTAVVSSGTLFSGDTLSGGSFAFTDKNVGAGNKTVTTSGVTVNDGNSGGNYNVSYTNNASSTITAKAITVSGLSASNKTYDGTTADTLTGTAVYSGVVGGDTVTEASSGSFADKNVGTGKTVTFSTLLGGADAGNYTVTNQANSSADITQASLVLSTGNVSKVYDGGTNVSGGLLAVAGGTLFSGDTLSGGSFAYTNKNAGSGNKTVTVSGATVSDGNSGSNYNVSYADNTTSTITPAALTISGITAANRTYNGDTTATVDTSGAVFSGLIGTDNVTVSATGTFADKNVGVGKTVTLSSTDGGADAANYTITNQASTTASITPAALTVSTANVSKVYDGTTTVVGGAAIAISGTLYGTDTLTGGSLVYASKNAGSGNKVVQVSGATIVDGNGGANYTLSYLNNTTSTITPAPLTISGITAANKVYDGGMAATVSTLGATYTGLIGTDLVNVTSSGVFGDKNVGTGKTVTLSNVVSGLDAGNYTITNQPTTVANITPATLTVSGLTVADRAYDGTTTAAVITGGAQYSGLVANDVFSVATSNGTFADKNVANGKVVTLVNTYTGADLGNYNVVDQNSTLASIVPASLTVTSSTVSKTYDGTTNVVGGTPLVAGGTLFGSDSLSGGNYVYNDKNAGLGTKVVSVTGVAVNDGNSGGNYTLHYTDNTASTISQAAITVSGVTADNKVYDGTTQATVHTGGAVYTGLISGDSVSVAATGTFDTANVGTGKTVTLASTYSGAAAANYIFTDQATTTADITKAGLTVTANNDARFVIQSDTPGYNGVHYDGFVGGDTAGTALNLGGLTVTRSNAGVGAAGVYSGVLVPSGVTSGNYTINYANGDYSILAANNALVKVVNLDTGYGSTPSYTVSSVQYLNGSNVIGTLSQTSNTNNSYTYSDGVGGTISFTLNPTSPTISGAGKVAVGNYAIQDAAPVNTGGNLNGPVTFTGNLGVQAAALTASASGVSKVYDGTTAMTGVTLSLTGQLTNDVVTVSGNGDFSQKNVGSGLSYAVSGLALGGADGGNYYLSGGSSLSGSDGAITPKSIVVGGITAGNKVYDGNRTAVVSVSNASFTGLVGGDDVAVDATGLFSDKNAGAGKTVTLSSSYSGADAGNYTFTDQGSTTADIATKSLTVSGVGVANRTYDGTAVATVQTSGALFTGLVVGDAVNFNSVTGVYADKNVGASKTVTLSSSYGGADVGNYAITSQATTTGDINVASITLSSSNVSKVYDGGTSANGVAQLIGGTLFGSDALSGGSFAFSDKNVGAGDKTVLVSGVAVADGNGGSNYAVTYANNTTSTITPKSLTVSGITAADKVYDATTGATVSGSGVVFGGMVSTDDLQLQSLSGVFTDKNAGTGKTVTLTSSYSGADVGNYIISSQASTTASITPKTVTVGGVSTNDKAYDGTTTVGVNTGGASYGGIIGGDDFSVASVGNTADKNAGNDKAVTLTGAGADAGNYAIVTAGGPVTVDIAPKAITLDGITAANRSYDGTRNATLDTSGFTFTGLVSGDSLNLDAAGGLFADKNVGNAKAVTITPTLSGADLANYVVTTTSPTANITPLTLTIGGFPGTDFTKTYDATTGVLIDTSGVTLGGLLAGDSLGFSSSGTTADKNVGVNKPMTITSLLTGPDAGNYAFSGTPTSGTVTIDKASLTINGIVGTTKVYDGTTFVPVDTSGMSFTGLFAGDVLTVAATGSLADKNVGVNKPVTIVTSYGGADFGNYDIAAPAPTTATVTPKALTISGITADNKTYDGNTSATVHTNGAVYTGLVSGDTLTVAAVGTFADANAGAGKSVLLTSTYSGADTGNYLITGQSTATANIDQAGLIVTANADARFVTQTDATGFNGVHYSGFMGGDTASSLNLSGLTVTRPNAGSDIAAGVYSGALVPSGITSANYAISYATGTYTILGANNALVKVVNNDSSYGGAPSFGLVSVQYMDGGNVISVLSETAHNGNGFTYSDGAGGSISFSLSPGNQVLSTGGHLVVGNYAIQDAAPVITGSNLAGPVTFTGNLAVQAVAAMVTPSGATKVYDGTASLNNVNLGLGGILSGDLVGVSGSGIFASKNAGSNLSYTISSLALSQVDQGNYYLSSGGSVSGTDGVITPKAVSVSGITAADKVYDATTHAALDSTGATVNGLVAGDLVTLVVSGAFSDKNVGNGKTVNLTSNYSGADAGNYAFTDQAATMASITPKTVTIGGSVSANDKDYDGTTLVGINTGGATYAGIVAGDDFGLSSFGNTADKNVGNDKAVTLGGMGADAGNYVIVQAGAPVTVDLAPKAISLDGITAAGRVYDGTRNALLDTSGATFTGLVAGDIVNFISATGLFADKNVGVDKVVTIAANLSGADLANYIITPTNPTATIDKLTLTFDGIPGGTGFTKTYDGSTVVNVDTSGVHFGGLLPGDDVGLSSVGNTADKNAGTNKPVDITNTLLGDDAGNYDISGLPTTGTVTITPKTIAVNGATAQDKNFDGTTLVNITGAGFAPGGVIAGDDLSLGNATTGNVADILPGDHKPVTTNMTLEGADRGNYVLEQPPGLTATINSAQPVIVRPPETGPESPFPVPGSGGGGPGAEGGGAGSNGGGEVLGGQPTLPTSPSGTGDGNGTGNGNGNGNGASTGDGAGGGAGSGNATGPVVDPGTGGAGNAHTGDITPQADSLTLLNTPAELGAEGGGFVSVLNFKPAEIQTGVLIGIALPLNTFTHSDPSAVLVYEARLPNDAPLPAWLSFDAGELRFSGTAPADAESFDVVVIARDKNGREARTKLRINVKKK